MTEYKLIKEMNESVDIIKNFELKENFLELENQNIFVTGEGSSRIFPAKNLIDYKLKNNIDTNIETQGSRQATLYDLSNHKILCSSNSGNTKELITLLKELEIKNHNDIFAVTANEGSKIYDYGKNIHLLNCGSEEAVAASKSVVEQALFYQSLFAGPEWENKDKAATSFQNALNQPIDNQIIETIKNSGVIYFAGMNNGVAEELSLKTSEITRLPGIYLEGTLLLHGVEEVMNKGETIVIIEPFEDDEDKIQELLVDKIGVNVVAISSRDTKFPTIKIDKVNGFDNFIQLAAGWNILLQIGLANNIDIDKPARARKVGNSI